MEKRTKNVVSVSGAILLIIGVTMSIPSYLNANYLGLGFSLFSIIVGAILLAITFGE